VPCHRAASALLIFSLLFPLLVLAGCIEEQQTPIKVDHLRFTGVKAVKKSQLSSVLATAQSSRLPWGTKHYFTRNQFEADLKRIVAFYRDRGYPDAKVASFDVKLNQKQDAADITVNIDEGQPILVEQIEFIGFDVLPPQHFASLRSGVPLKVGAPLDRALAQATRESALDEVKDHGYPYATVRMTDRDGGTDRRKILTLQATPGLLARYGPIVISGNSSVGDEVIRRQLTYRPGWRYRLSQLQESQRRLYGLETFRFANIEPDVKEGEQPESVPTKVTVVEGKHRKINFGLGYGTEEKARATIDWRHVNFFGGARTLQLEGKYSSLSRGVRANFRQPYLFSPRYELIASAQSWYDNEPAYKLNTDGGRIGIQRQLARPGPFSRRTATTTLALTYTHEWQNYVVSPEALADLSFRDELIALGLDPRTGKGNDVISSLGFDIRRSTADNAIDAKHGYVAGLHVEQAGKFLGGTADYWEAMLEGRYYLTLGQRAVLAVRARGGSIDGIGPEVTVNQQTGEVIQAVPFFKRYFAGGATSLRGWGRFEVSPLSGSGLPIGGTTLLETSTELRAPLFGNLSAVVFLDAGNVWTDPWDFNLNQLRYDVGPGLRYSTPIGPIRVDVGFQLNPEPGLLVNGQPEPRHFRVHFSIGQAF
jgi:outer membrane protein assembly complex protein YaeT